MQREYKISLSQEFYSDVVYLSQYDSDYDVIFKVMNKHSAVDVNGKSAKFTGTRKDGLGFTFEAVGIGSYVSFEINTSLTAVAGHHTAEIVFYDSQGLYFGSANVQVVVEPAARKDGTIDADTERAQEIAEEIQEIVDTAAATVKGKAEAWAVGQRDGVDVPSTDPAYENNAKFYAEQAAQIAEDISGVTEQVATNTSDISDLKEDLNTYVIDRFESVEPVNWWNDSAATLGVLAANGTTTESTTRCYSDYIPVAEGDVIRQFYKTSNRKIYRRNVCCYDSNKNVLATKGTDITGSLAWTVPSDVSYIRITIDTSYQEFAVITKNVETVTTYVAYFDPYDKIVEDFLTDETTQAIDSIKNQSDNYGYAMPMGEIHMTVGIPEKWYYISMMSPDFLKSGIAIGTAYSQRESDGVSFPNTESLESTNGYSFTVYDMYLNAFFRYAPNGGYGNARHIVTENLKNCSALVIGDSTVDFDTMTQKMLDYFASKSKTLALLGTLGNGNNRNEGRAGWKAQDYLTDKKYDGITNPFYNPATSTFDFGYYMSNQGYSSVDFVVVQLGINDLYNSGIEAIEPTWDAVQAIIDSVRAYNSSIKVLLNLPTTPNSNQAVHSVFLPLYFNRIIRYNQYAQNKVTTLYNASSVRCSYCHLILDPTTDIRDNVHPTVAGFEKMALEVINQINCWQNGV